jgi:demethylmenaquinone methyltransferase/2-methoxy-6-polyprenyl-1,4-benzoquinol methylase
MSLGIHRIWKRMAIEASRVRTGHHVLDVASGTGDLAYFFSKKVGDKGRVVVSDINENMLAVARDKLLDKGVAKNIEFIQANAEELPFEENSFDVVSMAFGLRNVTDKDKALRSILHVLKPGGRLMVLEFSKPISNTFSKIYDAYSFTFLPLAGKIIAQDSESYRYLAESIRMHPDQLTLKSMFEQAGFKNTTYNNLTGGIVAIHSGVKPY